MIQLQLSENANDGQFEIDGVGKDVAREALRLAAMKLPIKTRTVVREDW